MIIRKSYQWSLAITLQYKAFRSVRTSGWDTLFGIIGFVGPRGYVKGQIRIAWTKKSWEILFKIGHFTEDPLL